MEEDPFELQRFLTAQASSFEAALAELHAGRKRSHWMWFIFPQLRGLGLSPTAQFYGISSLDEARAYLANPILGPRLERVTRVVLFTQGLTAHQIFDSPDDLKFHSSMTLFHLASSVVSDPFSEALSRWFGGRMDDESLKLLKGADIESR
jgi:uncharacterized protein (DUF1810 family)